MESYYQAKKLLFTESLAEGGNAIINIDDPWGERLAAELHPEVRTLSMTKPASIRIELQEATASGTRFLLDCRGERMEIHAPLIGRYNVYNLSSAIAGALFAGVPKEKIPEILKDGIRIPGRLEKMELPSGGTAFVDYAHTDDALERVLSALRPLCRGELIVVFGCGGDRDRTKRPRMAAVCGRIADRSILTSDNPRTEPPEAIIDEAKQGFPPGTRFETIPDRREAVRRAVALTGPGDILLVAGKGHETTQEIQGVKYHMDDRELIREACS